jgi:hypothetical protein
MNDQASDEDVEVLKKFYSVETERELISAQDRHIASLQATVAALRPEERIGLHGKVREG